MIPLAEVTIISQPIAAIVFNSQLTLVSVNEQIIAATIVAKGADGADAEAEARIIGETLAGTINNINTVFTTAFNFDPNSIRLFINGFSQVRGVDYTVTAANAITLTFPAIIGDSLQVDYQKA